MRTLLILITIAISTPSIAGGPWLAKKKSGFFQLQTTFPERSYNNLFLGNGNNRGLNRSVLDLNFQAYLEYGVSDKFNITAVLPYKYVSTGNPLTGLNNPTLLQEGSLSGFSNTRLGFKYRVSDKNLKVAVSVQSSLNTISKSLDEGLITGYDANSVGLYAHIGKSFTNKIYSFIEGGINKNSNDFSDFIDVHYELGLGITNSFWFILNIDVRESLENGSFRNDNLRQTGLYTNDQEYFAFGPKLAFELKNQIGFTIASHGAFSGNFVAKVATFSFGIHKKW